MTRLDQPSLPGASDEGRVTTIAAGMRIDVAPGELIELRRGAIERRSGHRLVDVREAPALLGFAAALDLDDMPRFELRASTDVSIARTPRAAFGAERWARLLARELAHRDAQALAGARRHDELFERGAGARVAPGPYRFGPFDALAFVVRGAPVELPSGLRVAPGLAGVSLVVVSFIEGAAPTAGERAGAAFGYAEVATFVPCVSSEGWPGMYGAALFPDATMPILLGREIYGFPKRLGRIVRWGGPTEPEGIDLYVGHRRVMRARFDGRRAVEVGRFGAHLGRAMLGEGSASAWASRALGGALGVVDRTLGRIASGPRARILVEKRIPSEAPSRRPAPRVHELVEVPFTIFGLGGYATLGDVEIEFDAETMGVNGVARAGVAFRMGFELGDGRVVVDHRPPRRWWQRARVGGRR